MDDARAHRRYVPLAGIAREVDVAAHVREQRAHLQHVSPHERLAEQLVLEAAQLVRHRANLPLRALDAGAEDFAREDDQYLVTTSPSDFHAVKSALEAKKVSFVEAEPVVMVPKSTVKVEGKNAEQLLKLMEELEDLDDVQKVWANFDIDVADMAASA